jgi:hypothetical protein
MQIKYATILCATILIYSIKSLSLNKQYCRSYHPDLESCLYCQDSYWDFENKLCHPVSDDLKTPNCIVYEKENSKLGCLKCDFGYHPVDGLCIAFEVENCSYNHFGFTECTACMENFAPVDLKETDEDYEDIGMKCVEIPNGKNSIYETDTYEGFSWDINCRIISVVGCLECKEGYSVYSGDMICKISTVDNCLFLSDEGDECELCQHGFYVDNQNKCRKNSDFVAHSLQNAIHIVI